MARRTSLLGGGNQAALSALCRRALPSKQLRLALRSRLLRMLDFDAYCVNTCDLENGTVLSSVGDGLSPENARQLFALEAEGCDVNSLSELRQGPVRVRSIWKSTGGAPAQSRRMRQIFLPLGWGDELRAALVVDGICFGYLHLFRALARAPFQASELRLVAQASPLIAHGLREARSREARLRPGSRAPRAPHPALIVLDPAHRVVQQSATADAALGRPDALPAELGLPHVLHDLASRSRVGAPARAVLTSSEAEPVSLVAVPLGAETAIVVDQIGALEQRELTFALSGLTPRERAVSTLVASGQSNQAIASELRIALHTVKDHMKSILTKTGCASRSELTARLCGG